MRAVAVTSDLAPDLRVISIRDVASQLRVSQRTAEDLLRKNGVALIALSAHTRVISENDYGDMLRRCRREASAEIKS